MFGATHSSPTLIYETIEQQHFYVPLLQDRLWRKSRSSHNNGTCFGTDLNRNFNVAWCSKYTFSWWLDEQKNGEEKLGQRWITGDTTFKKRHLILHSSLDFLTSVLPLRDDIIHAVRTSNTQAWDPFQVGLAKQGQRRPRSKRICLKSITLFLNIWIFTKKRKKKSENYPCRLFLYQGGRSK